MPGLLKKDEPAKVAGAIAYQAQESSGTNENVPQPRQPTSLHGLLRFAMESTGNEDAPGPSVMGSLDEERRRFLENALKSMTIDVIELLLKQIKVFENVTDVTADSDITEYTSAFDTILDYVDNVDIANDFHKIGGFTIFDPCLKCAHPTIRAGACDLIAELCQNNPYCQRVVTENGFIPLILGILQRDEDEVCVKAMYALSSIIRDNEDGLQIFVRCNGIELVMNTIKKEDDKLRTKSAFFLGAICRMQGDLKEKLITSGYLQILMSILSEERTPSHEHILYLLKDLVESSEAAVHLCQESQYNLRVTLINNWEITKDKGEFSEEHQYCQQVLNHLFPDWSN